MTGHADSSPGRLLELIQQLRLDLALLQGRVRVLEEADDTDGLADRIAEIERTKGTA